MAVAVCDYGLGNLYSVGRALSAVGVDFEFDTDGSIVRNAEVVLIPGVGAFGDGARRLEESGQADAIRGRHAAGARIVGVCLGAQMLLDESDEAPGVNGLGLLRGTCSRLTPSNSYRIPNQDWHKVEFSNDAKAAEWQDSYFYFSHSFEMSPSDPRIVCARVSIPDVPGLVAGVVSENVLGVQFHPEKSARSGLSFLKWSLTSEWMPQ